MAIDNQSFYKYQEHRGQAGYKAAILVKEQQEPLYSMLVASETVPSVFGTQNSFEFDLLNSPVVGKVAGKMTLDDKEVECLLHRDNVYRFEQLKDKVLDFLYLTPDFVGWKFSGTISFRANDASADILRGTYTITPMSADPNPIMDCRGLIQETLCFADVIPEHIKSTDTLNLSVVQKDATVTYSAKTIDGTTVTVTSSTVEKATLTGITKSGVVAITASATGYASWTTTVYVEVVTQ